MALIDKTGFDLLQWNCAHCWQNRWVVMMSTLSTLTVPHVVMTTCYAVRDEKHILWRCSFYSTCAYLPHTNVFSIFLYGIAGILLGMRSANELWRVTPSRIGWAHTQNYPWNWCVCAWPVANIQGALHKYAHRFVVLWFVVVIFYVYMDSYYTFTHILHGYFIGNEISLLP